MNAQTAIELGRDAIWTALVIGSPVLIAALVVGLIIGLLQSLTQIQEQSVAFVPKIIAMFLVLTVTLPWLIDRMMQYTSALLGGIADKIG